MLTKFHLLGHADFAFKDVIICAGTFNTPKILMLSGIGPPEELAEHGIPVQVPLSGVGQNLADHPSLRLYTRVNVDAIPSDGKPGGDVSTWRDQWLKDQKGPLAMVPNKFTNGYFKIDNLEHLSGWKQLDDHTKDYLMRPLTSNIEYLAVGIPVVHGSTYIRFELTTLLLDRLLYQTRLCFIRC